MSKDDKNSLISQALVDYYLKDYIEILGISVGITEYYPQQADSQIRNAMTHLSRAAFSDEIEVVKEEIEKFKAHLERAKRDCLKLAIIRKKKDVTDHIKSVHLAKGGLPEDIMERRLQVLNAHRVAFINESKGRDVAAELEKVLTELIELEECLIKFDKIAFQPSRTVYIAARLIRNSRRVLSIIGMGFLIYLISRFSTFFYNSLFQNNIIKNQDTTFISSSYLKYRAKYKALVSFNFH